MSHIRLKTEYTVEGSYGSRDKCILYADRNISCDITTFYDERGEAICSFEDVEHPNLLDAMNELNSGMPETNPKIQWAQIPEAKPWEKTYNKEELKKYILQFWFHWFNHVGGTNTEQGLDEWMKKNII